MSNLNMIYVVFDVIYYICYIYRYIFRTQIGKK